VYAILLDMMLGSKECFDNPFDPNILKELVSHPISIDNDMPSLPILQSIQQVEMHLLQISEVEASIHEVMEYMDFVIKTIPVLELQMVL